MSNFKKVLVFVLCATLLIGALCVVATADGESKKVAVPKSYTDFEGESIDFDANMFASGTLPSVFENGMAGRAGVLKSAHNGDNTYVRLYNNKGNAFPGNTSTLPYLGVKFGGYNSQQWSLASFGYVTMDLEFCADKYVDADGKFTDDAENGTLSYIDGMQIRYMVRAKPGGAVVQNNTVILTVTKDADGDWCLLFDGKRFKLSQVAGEWNHLTFVYAVDQTPIYRGKQQAGWMFSQSDMYVYLNGNHILTHADAVKPEINEAIEFNADGSAWSTFGLDQLRLTWPSLDAFTKQDSSFGLDNIYVNYYPNGYTGGLDKVVADTTKSLFEADDVLIKDNYHVPYPNKPIASVDDALYYYEGAATGALKENSVIEIYNDFYGVYKVKFPFVAKLNGHAFDYVAGEYEGQTVGDNIHFIECTDPLQVIFDGDPKNSQYKGYLFNDSYKTTFGGVPVYPEEIPEYFYVSETETFWKFLGWSTEKDATSPLSALPEITAKDVYLGKYYLYPVYDKTFEPCYFLTVDNVKTGFLSFDGLEEHLKIDGACIEFNQQYLEMLKIENDVTIKINEKCNQDKIIYYSDTKIADVTDKVYTFRTALEEEFVDVKWYGYTDNELATEKRIPGGTFVINTYDETMSELYYDPISATMFKFLGWSETKGGTTALESTYTLDRESEGVIFYPVYEVQLCLYTVTVEGSKVGYMNYNNLKEHLSIDGAKIVFNTPYTKMLEIENSVIIDNGGTPLVYYSTTRIASQQDCVYTFRAAVEGDYVVVKWVDLKGNVIASEKHLPGNTINAPEGINPTKDNLVPGNLSETESTHYFDFYMAWDKTLVVAEGENIIEPTNVNDAYIEINVRGVKYNLSALSYFKLNVYVPKPENDNVSILRDDLTPVTIDGVDYYAINGVGVINANSIDEINLELRFTVFGQTVTYPITISLPQYFQSILGRDNITDEERDLIVTAVNYCNQAYKICNGGESYAPYDEIVAANSDVIEAMNALLDAESKVSNTSANTKKVNTLVNGYTIYYTTDDFRPVIAFSVNTEVVDGDVVYTPVSGITVGKTNFSIECDYDGVSVPTKLVEVTDGEGNTVTLLVPDYTGLEEMAMYSIADEFQLEFWRGNNTSRYVRNYKYSLATYVKGLEAEGQDASLGRALYAFSVAAGNYNDAVGKDDSAMISQNK